MIFRIISNFLGVNFFLTHTVYMHFMPCPRKLTTTLQMDQDLKMLDYTHNVPDSILCTPGTLVLESRPSNILGTRSKLFILSNVQKSLKILTFKCTIQAYMYTVASVQGTVSLYSISAIHKILKTLLVYSAQCRDSILWAPGPRLKQLRLSLTYLRLICNYVHNREETADLRSIELAIDSDQSQLFIRQP